MTRPLALWGLVLGLAGCGITPVPDPPEFDPGLATVAPDDMGTIVVTGMPGAASGQVVVVNLETGDEPATATAAEDGSFTIRIGGQRGDVVRVQARGDGARTESADYSAGGTEVFPQNTGCLQGPREIDAGVLSAGERVRVRIENGCVDVTDLDRVLLRRGVFAIATTTPTTVGIPPGMDFDVELQPPAAPGLYEDVLLVYPTAGTIDRIAVSLFAEVE